MTAVRKLAIAFIIMLLCPLPSHAAPRDITMAVFIVPPLITKDVSGQYGGSVIEVIEHIASKEGWSIRYKECALPACLEMLSRGEVDLMGPNAYTEERSRTMDYTQETFFMDWGQIYSSPDEHIESILDLKGKRIAVLKKTAQLEPFNQLMKTFGIDYEPVFVDDYLDVFKYVQQGKAHALMINRIFGERHMPEFDVVRTPVIFTPIDIRYAVPKGRNADVIEGIDTRLRELKKDQDSMYYRSIEAMFGPEAVSRRLPSWASWAALGGLSALLAAIGFNLWLRGIVRERTLALQQEVEQHESARRALVQSRESFRVLVEGTSAVHWVYDIQADRFEYVGPQASNVLGYAPEQWTDFDSWADKLHPDDRARALEYCKAQTSSAMDHECIYRLIKPDGSVLWIRDIVKVASEQGRPVKLMGIFLDITESKRLQDQLVQSLREKDILLKEIHHRVKNNMQIISSLLQLQARGARDLALKDALKESQGRIKAMALVHEQLYKSRDFVQIDMPEYISSLTRSIHGTFSSKDHDVSLTLDIDAPSLSIDQLVPSGLIVNELLSNAYKYAFVGRASGAITVSFKRHGDDRLALQVSDNGVGLPEGKDPLLGNTLGLTIVQSLVEQLGGSLSVQRSGGLTFRVEFPVTYRLSSPG